MKSRALITKEICVKKCGASGVCLLLGFNLTQFSEVTKEPPDKDMRVSRTIDTQESQHTKQGTRGQRMPLVGTERSGERSSADSVAFLGTVLGVGS